jgi:ATP-binding cassette subfamily F protein uup
MSLPLFYFRNLYLSFGQTQLFNNINVQVCAQDIICLVGKNGSGKSTLLKLMAQIVEPDKAEIYYQPNVRIAYLAQQPDISKDMQAIEYVMQNFKLDKDETIEHKKYLAEIILDKLKMSPDKNLSSLSGGELRRVDLARVLAMESDLLFLDEPTNHLDIQSIEWLEEYLKNFAGGVVIVSHDRSFLSNVSNRTLWLDRGNLLYNNQGYKNFEKWSEEVFAQEEIELVKLGKKLDKENLWLQQGVTARRKRNQQRLSELHALREKISSEKSRFNSISSSIKTSISTSENKAKLLAEFKEISFGYPSQSTLILKPFSLSILKGEKIGVMGRNGAGKSTFIKLLTQDLSPSSGQIQFGTNLECSYIDQTRSSLNQDQTLWETLCPNGGDTIFLKDKTKHVVAYLKDFLFNSTQATAKVSSLSGGEQNRLLLAKLLINPGNFLILDEPTNDLDIDTLDMLVEILSEYKGTLLIVSHDRDFLERLVTRTIIIENNSVTDFIGGYEDYLKNKKNAPLREERKTTTPRLEKEKTITKLSYKDERELSLLPERIENLSKEITKLEKQLETPNLYQEDLNLFNLITNGLIKTKEELEQAETRWLELEEKKYNLTANINN